MYTYNKMIRRFATIMLAFLLMLGSVMPVSAASAAWQPETVLDPSYGGYAPPHVAINSRGAAAVVWDQLNLNTFVNQVAVSVTTRTGWKTADVVSDPNVDSANLGVIVTPAGKVMVLWVSAGVINYSVYNGAGWTAGQALPADAGYSYFAGAGVDQYGNIQIALGSPQPTAPLTYNVEALIMTSQGVWKPPLLITTVNAMGTPRMVMNPNGKALLFGGARTYYSSKPGAWDAEKSISLVGGQVFVTDAALDSSGRAYFIYRTHYTGFYLSTSTPTTAWTAPQQVPLFDTLGSEVHIVGSSTNHAMIYGTDYTNGEVSASVTTNGGGAWSPMVSFGTIIDIPVAVGGANGLYALAWNDGLDMKVAAGSGAGTGTKAWMVKTVASNYAEGAVAINGKRVVSAWWRATDPMYSSVVIGASLGTVGP